MSNPFAAPPSTPGRGSIYLALLPPDQPRLRTVNYQYPLKLVHPAPIRTASEPKHLIHTVYLLTYGGGLVAGDAIDLHVHLDPTTRLVLLTQGSTKLFKSPSVDLVSRQSMTIDVAPGSALCYLPDPVQPFAKSCFEQQQIYNVTSAGSGPGNGSICALDWVSNGRPANGENWSFFRYGSRNEIYLSHSESKRKLLLRDNMVLDGRSQPGSVALKMDGLAVYGTLILYGSMFTALGHFFMQEFTQLPRIGGKKFESSSDNGSGDEEVDSAMDKRMERHRAETAGHLLWSAASVRGCVVVKFGAPTVEAGRRWLHAMLSAEGSVSKHFGESALLCLK